MNPKSENSLSFRQRIHMAAEELDLPAGMLSGLPQLTLDGDAQLLIEHHMGIVEYGEARVRIASKCFTIQIVGSALHLVAMDKDSIRIRGHISGVEYLDGSNA